MACRVFGKSVGWFGLVGLAGWMSGCGDAGDGGSTASNVDDSGSSTNSSTADDAGSTTGGMSGTMSASSSGSSDSGSGDGSESLTASTGDGEPGYCPGEPEWSEPVCRTQDDCEGQFQSCVAGPSDCGGPGCGSDCASDLDCMDFSGRGVDGVCLFTGVGCCGDAGNCVAACTSDSCAADEQCAADGHCVPISCDDEFLCAKGLRCQPDAAGSDRHGCELIPCDEQGATGCAVTSTCVDGSCQRIGCDHDADCPCGSCIEGGCWERPWICYEPPA
jgi:hypothetical protein